MKIEVIRLNAENHHAREDDAYRHVLERDDLEGTSKNSHFSGVVDATGAPEAVSPPKSAAGTMRAKSAVIAPSEASWSRKTTTHARMMPTVTYWNGMISRAPLKILLFRASSI